MQTRLRRTFWWITAGLFVFVAVTSFGQPFENWMGATLIILAALLPVYLWVMRKIAGMPIFPFYALTFIWIYAIPLISDHPIIVLFPPAFRFMAALSVTGFLLVATAAWYLVGRRPVKRAATCWMFDESRADLALLIALGLSLVVTLITNAGAVNLGAGVFSIVRAVMLASEALICFVLSYRLSRGKLPAGVRVPFYVLLAAISLVNIATLLLITTMSLLGLSIIAYFIGSRTLPWRLSLVAVIVFSFLHYGKGPMREKYWRDEETFVISPLKYPGLFAEWAMVSWDMFTHGDPDENPESLAQRASLMHLLLYMQAVTPASLPYLYGESYAVIPAQFVPRIFYPDKPRSHAGTYILTVYYNLQTVEDTDVTTIDIGLVNEAYANFGYLGMGALAVILGSFFAATARWASGMPIFSFRSLFAVLVMGSVLQASSSAGFYVATLYQSVIVLITLSLVLMRPMRPDPHRSSFLE